MGSGISCFVLFFVIKLDQGWLWTVEMLYGGEHIGQLDEAVYNVVVTMSRSSNLVRLPTTTYIHSLLAITMKQDSILLNTSTGVTSHNETTDSVRYGVLVRDKYRQ